MPHCTTRLAQSSSCHREKPPSFCRRPEGLFHSPASHSGWNRVSKQRFWWDISIGSSPFLCLLVWVSGSQGDHQKQKPWDLNTWKTFSCMLRKNWQPSSFLHHCCQVHAGCQIYTLLKQDYRRKNVTHNHFASCLEPCSDAGSSPSQRSSTALHSTWMMLQNPPWTALFRSLSCQHSHQEP